MKNMKKVVIGGLAAGMVLAIGTTSAFAAGQGLGAGKNFVDADKNGICDYADNICNYVELKHDEVTKRYENVNAPQSEAGQNYVDADNDGVCDNNGQNYVDADNDSVCDNYGTGKGRRFRGGRNK